MCGQIYLGDDAFVQRTQARAETLSAPDVPRAQRRPRPHPLPWYLKRYDRDEAIVRAFAEGGYTQTAIAKAVDLSVSWVSRLIAGAEAKGRA